MSIGFGIFLAFFIVAIFVSSQIHRTCDTRLDRTIENETKKYSMNLPVPIRWRLDMTIYARRLSAASPTDIQYYVGHGTYFQRNFIVLFFFVIVVD